MGKIDYKNSIRKQRLIIKTTFLEKMGVFFIWIFGSVALLLISLAMLFGSIKFNWFNESATQIILSQLVSFSIFAFVIAGLIKNNNLVKIKVTSNDQTRFLVKKSTEIFKNKITQSDNVKELVVGIKSGPFANERQLIVLFDQNDIYFNCRTYARPDLISPVHWVVHKRIINKLIKEIETQQHNNVCSPNPATLPLVVNTAKPTICILAVDGVMKETKA